MNIVYHSNQYYVVEYPDWGGFELINKLSRQGAFIQGNLAESFKNSLVSAFSEEPTTEQMDEFLGNFDALMSQQMTLH